jgi:hypothetical protein
MKTRCFAGVRSSARNIFRCVAFSLAAWLISTSEAQIVAWDVSGMNAAANNPFAAGTLNSLIASATLSLGSGVTASATSNTFGGSGFNQTSFAGAISTGDYLSFTVTPAASADLSLSSVSLLLGVATAVTNFNVALASSVTGFTTSDAIWSFSFATASPALQTVALSGVAALQHLGSAVEFRVYGWRDTTGTTTFRIRDNSGSDLSLAGTVSAVPEPSAYAAVAGGLSLAVAVRRWRKHRLQGQVSLSGKLGPPDRD